MNNSISVILPVYDNSSTIEELYALIKKEVANYTHEIIFVIDASPDDSLQKIIKIQDQDPCIRSHYISQNVGQNKATLKGFQIAKMQTVLVMDADLQDSPAYIPLLIGELHKGHDAVFVKRLGQYQKRERMLTSMVHKWILFKLTGLHFKAGSYYIVSKDIINQILSSNIQRPVCTILVAMHAQSIGYISAPRKHNMGKSGYNFKKRLLVAINGYTCALLNRPKSKNNL